MTRLLSELLGAEEPKFSLNLRELERASGAPSADIRLSATIMRRVHDKLRELNLDPTNTTGEELYEALQLRLLADEGHLRQHLAINPNASSSEVLSVTEKLFKKLDVPRSSFALKLSVAKRLFTKLPPQKTMRQLGYRSLTSMLKHEPVPQIYAASLICESGAWHQHFTELYKDLKPSDFESRQIAVYFPNSKHWLELASKFAGEQRHILATFRELGSIILLPVDSELPALGLTSLLLMLEGLNDIRCSSAFLKLQQVKPDFGNLVIDVLTNEPLTSAHLAQQPLPWKIIQYYYSKKHNAYYPELFEPHVQPEDLELAKSEASLATQMPELEFWVGSDCLAMTDSGQAISLNMLDVALSTVNHHSFTNRILSYMRDHVWRELLICYMKEDNLERVVRQLGDELVDEPARLSRSSKNVKVIGI